jgi:hypothetical protein
MSDHRTADVASPQNGHPGATDAAPFDPTDPFDSQCERLRREVIQLVIDSDKVTLFREMSAQRQLECTICGLMTGMIGAAFASINQTEEARDYIIEYLTSCIPVARRLADAMNDAGVICDGSGDYRGALIQK